MKSCLIIDPWPMMHAVLGDVIRVIDPDIEVVGVLSVNQISSLWEGLPFDFYIYHQVPEAGCLSSFLRLRFMFPRARGVILCESKSDLLTISADFRGVLVLEKHFSYKKVIAKLREFVPVESSSAASQSDGYTTGAGVKICRRLSKKQLRVMDLAARGFSTKEIARELGISTETVKTHLSECFRRLGVSNRSAAVMKFIDMKENLEMLP